jgi:hypothetical protein
MLGASASLFIVACRKDEPSSIGPLNAPKEASATPRVLAFVSKAALPPGTKNYGQLGIDSAEWYVEAALNYTLAETHKGYEDLERDSLVHTMSISGTAVADGDVIAAYNDLKTTIESSIDGERYLVVVDVVRKEENGVLVLTTYPYYSREDLTRRGLNTTFRENEHYLWDGPAQCACDPNGVQSDDCAHRQIQFRINAAHVIGLGPNDYITDVEVWYVGAIYSTDPQNFTYDSEDFLNPANTSGLWNQNYLMYRCESTQNCSTCLDHIDLSYHTQGTYDIMQHIRATHCPNKLFLISMGDAGWAGDLNSTLYYHNFRFTYGKLQSGVVG